MQLPRTTCCCLSYCYSSNMIIWYLCLYLVILQSFGVFMSSPLHSVMHTNSNQCKVAAVGVAMLLDNIQWPYYQWLLDNDHCPYYEGLTFGTGYHVCSQQIISLCDKSFASSSSKPCVISHEICILILDLRYHQLPTRAST
jgi:hypothetical protein